MTWGVEMRRARAVARGLVQSGGVYFVERMLLELRHARRVSAAADDRRVQRLRAEVERWRQVQARTERLWYAALRALVDVERRALARPRRRNRDVRRIVKRALAAVRRGEQPLPEVRLAPRGARPRRRVRRG